MEEKNRDGNGRITIRECFDEIIKQGNQLTELKIVLVGIKESWGKREDTCPKEIDIKRLQDSMGYLKIGRDSDKISMEKFDKSLEEVKYAVTGWKANLKLFAFIVSASGIFAFVFSKLGV